MADVTIELPNEVYAKIICAPNIAYEIRDRFTFKVPGYQFMPAYRNKIWDGTVKIFNVQNHQIYRGLVPEVLEFLKKNSYTCDHEVYKNSFSLTEATQFANSLNLKYVPYEHQMSAFVHAIQNQRSLLLSATSSGKSLYLYMICRYLLANIQRPKTKGLIIVPTIGLVEQMAKDFQEYSPSWNTDEHIHRVHSGTSPHSDKSITLSTWQSLQRQPAKFFEKFNFVINDEAHLAKANATTAILTKCTKASFRIGTTGTLDGSKCNKMVLEGLFGPVCRVITTAELIERKQAASFKIEAIVLQHSDVPKMDYPAEMKYLIGRHRRNRFLANLALSRKGNTLLLYQFVEQHGKILFDMITARNKNPKRKIFFISGDTDVTIREEVRRLVELENDAIIVASSGTTSTGVNIRNIHNIIFGSPSKARIKNLQSIGRALRISDTKDSAVLYDIADDLRSGRKTENFTLGHFFERVKIYNEEKFTMKIHKVVLKGDIE